MNNVGGKLKGVSIIVIVLGVIVSVIYGIMIIGDSLFTGIAVIAAGILGTLIFGFALYGLGQIVDNTDEKNIPKQRALRRKNGSGRSRSLFRKS